MEQICKESLAICDLGSILFGLKGATMEWIDTISASNIPVSLLYTVNF